MAKNDAALFLVTRVRKNVKYFIPPSGIESHNRRVYSRMLVPLCHDGLIYNLLIGNKFLFLFPFSAHIDVLLKEASEKLVLSD